MLDGDIAVCDGADLCVGLVGLVGHDGNLLRSSC